MAQEKEKIYRDETASFAAKISFPNSDTIPDSVLPPVSVYVLCLDEICRREGIDRDTARSKYGLYTWGQWKELLNYYRVNNRDNVL